MSLTWEEIDRLMGEDPGDRLDREAHGFAYEDDFEDRTLLCRNGCGLSYFEIVCGKIRLCRVVPIHRKIASVYTGPRRRP